MTRKYLDSNRCIWEDESGTMHIDGQKVLELCGLRDTRRNQRKIDRMIRRIVSEKAPNCVYRTVHDLL